MSGAGYTVSQATSGLIYPNAIHFDFHILSPSKVERGSVSRKTDKAWRLVNTRVVLDEDANHKSSEI